MFKKLLRTLLRGVLSHDPLRLRRANNLRLLWNDMNWRRALSFSYSKCWEWVVGGVGKKRGTRTGWDCFGEEQAMLARRSCKAKTQCCHFQETGGESEYCWVRGFLVISHPQWITEQPLSTELITTANSTQTKTVPLQGPCGKAAQCRQKVCSSKRPPKLEPRSVRANEVFENLACRISPE